MRRYEQDKPQTIAAAKRWEFQYAVGAVAYCGMLGIWCLVGIGFNDDQTVHLLCAIVTVANVVAGASRVSGQPYIVLLDAARRLRAARARPAAAEQSVLCGDRHPDLAVLPRAAPHHRRPARDQPRRRRSRRTRSRCSASRFDTALNNMPHGLCMFDAERRARGLQPAARPSCSASRATRPRRQHARRATCCATASRPARCRSAQMPSGLPLRTRRPPVRQRRRRAARSRRRTAAPSTSPSSRWRTAARWCWSRTSPSARPPRPRSTTWRATTR